MAKLKDGKISIKFTSAQENAYLSKSNEILFGGAKMGGKSYFIRMSAIFYALAFPGVQIVIFRRTHPELKMSYMQGQFGFPALMDMFGYTKSYKGNPPKAKINQSTNTIQFANSSNIMLRHCAQDNDVELYRGIEFHIIYLDEATHFTG